MFTFGRQCFNISRSAIAVRNVSFLCFVLRCCRSRRLYSAHGRMAWGSSSAFCSQYNQKLQYIQSVYSSYEISCRFWLMYSWSVRLTSGFWRHKEEACPKPIVPHHVKFVLSLDRSLHKKRMWNSIKKSAFLLYNMNCSIRPLKTRLYTGSFTTLGHNCRRWFPTFLWSKKFI